jgi:hypothetical protein
MVGLAVDGWALDGRAVGVKEGLAEGETDGAVLGTGVAAEEWMIMTSITTIAMTRRLKRLLHPILKRLCRLLPEYSLAQLIITAE